MFKAPVDSFGRAIGGVGMIEVGQDVPGSAFECPAQRHELAQAPRYTRAGQCINFGLHQGLTADFVGIAVGVDNVLVDAPSDLEGDVAIAGEQDEDLMLLAWREQAGSGAQASCGPCTGGLCPGRADGEALARCACDTHRKHPRPRCTTWKGSMTALASGSSSAAALLNPVNPSIATISMRLRHVSGREASQVLKTCLERPGTISKSRQGPLRSRMGVKSKITGSS